MENKIQKIKKEKNQSLLVLEVESKLDLLVNGQKINSNKLEDIANDLRKGFIGLALRNEELLKSNDQLKQQLLEMLIKLCDWFPRNFLANQILAATALELDILHSYGKILKISSLLTKLLVIKS